MKQDKFNIIKLRKWLSGDISLSEEQALEQAAKEDPFLRDAMEGYAQFPAGDHTERTSRIKAQLRYRNKRSRKIGWVRYAAAAVIVLTSLLAVRFLIRPAQLEQVVDLPNENFGDHSIEAEAGATEVTKDMPVSNEESPTAFRKMEQDANIPPTEDKARMPKPVSPIAEGADVRTEELSDKGLEIDGQSAELEVPGSMDDEAMVVAKDTRLDKEESLSPVTVHQPERLLEETQEAERFVQEIKPLNGQVVNEKGEPLIGASVYNVSEEIGTLTDVKGRFQMTTAEPGNLLTFSYTGYSTESLLLPNTDSLSIQLFTDGAVLDEVVVSGAQKEVQRARKSKKKLDASYSYPGASEKNQTFDDFIKAHLKYPIEAKINRIEGEVLLRFEVDKRGRPINIEVLRSLGFGCNQEAIRLLSAGPNWPTPKRRSDRKKVYSIPFQLK